MPCEKCGGDHSETIFCPTITQSPVKFEIIHDEWKIDVKISNDNTKGEKRVTVHYRSDTETVEDARKKAHEIYTTSTDYLDANITNTWEKNLAHFHGEHAPSTKFRSQNHKRSKVFRPKTRAMTKASEAALTSAMFSTQDVLDISPQDPSAPIQIASAAVNKEILGYRLDKQVPWYQTTVGAFQSTKVYGLCISFQCYPQ